MGEAKGLASITKEMRRGILEMAMETGINHIASSLSVVEILCAVFSFAGGNDKIILSKGHGCLGYYILLREKGYNPPLKAHPDIDIKNGIECTTGSLGHGLPIAVGMALAKKLKKEEGNIYTVMGDGECQEGTSWESFMIASHYRLNNLYVIIDHNKLQALDSIDKVISLGNLWAKLNAFGCDTTNINGHNLKEIMSVLRNTSRDKINPKVIIANTIKGKGVSFMENNPMFHARLPNEEELAIARKELE